MTQNIASDSSLEILVVIAFSRNTLGIIRLKHIKIWIMLVFARYQIVLAILDCITNIAYNRLIPEDYFESIMLRRWLQIQEPRLNDITTWAKLFDKWKSLTKQQM